MKPVNLRFRGINSFSESTEINFEKLTSNGIFGIFGDTGSGKSTILDCINFALYGKVERSKEKLDIINYRSESAEVRFEFDVLSEGKRKRYTVERSLKKKSGLHKAMLYEGDKCIADNASTVTKKITEVLGVDAEDFRKCIALPQGEFSQFVKSQPSERIALIERLFSLFRYGDRLKERLKIKESQCEIAYRETSAKLGMLDDVSSAVLKNIENQIKGLKEQAKSINKELIIAENEYNRLNALEEKRDELDKTNLRLEKLKAQKSRIDELREGLKAAPVCKAVVDSDRECNNKKNLLVKLDTEFAEIEKSISNVQGNLQKLSEREAKENYDKKIEECIALSAKYSSCEGKPEKFARLEKALIAKRDEYRVRESQLNKLKERLSEIENQYKDAERRLSEFGSKNLEQLINVDFKGAILKDEYVNSLDYFVGLNGQIKFFKDNSELYQFLSRELKQQIENYKDRVYQVKDFSLQKAQENLKNFQAADEERDKIISELNDKRVALKDVESAVESCKKDIEIILRDGEELRKQRDEIKAELKNIFGAEENYSEVKENNERSLEKLKKDKAILSCEIEKSKSALSELTAKKAAKQVEIKSVSEEVVKLEKDCKLLLEKSGFGSVDECRRLAEDFSEFGNAEKAIEDFDAEWKALTLRLKNLEGVDGINEFTKDALISARCNKEKISASIVQAREQIAVMESDLNKSKERLEEKKKLQSELAVVDRERNLVAQLKDLTKGNKFMEYIANEYLYDISTLASSTLLNLTDGRYFLTYTDNFYAGDNFDCGNLRGVNTLSGGETFLVSLSLALALSQTICSSLKSIEFFFLDEGFGTLDGTLVDTVMSALEKLKSSSFTIGIISHVEELKHRINNKITVYKATESRGSTIQLSC